MNFIVMLSGVLTTQETQQQQQHQLSSPFLKSNQPMTTTTTFERHYPGAPPCSPIIDPSQISFTLVTQSSMNRLWLMQRHCELWKGPISVAVLTGKSSAEMITERLTSLGCQDVTVSVLHEQDYSNGDYPVNTLRNLAIQKVQTTHLVYVDVDFWLSANLNDILQMNSLRQHLSQDSKLAVVLPAFQLERDPRCKGDHCKKKAKDLMPQTMDELVDLQNRTIKVWGGKRSPRVSPFDSRFNPQGHNSTLYHTWYQQPAGTLVTIPCIQSPRYEPFLIVRYCHDLPPLPEAFTGYGKNKVAWIFFLRRAGYLFQQLGQAFVVHYPHEKSTAKRAWMEYTTVDLNDNPFHNNNNNDPNNMNRTDALANLKRVQMDEIFVQFRNWLSALPTPGVRTPRCDQWNESDQGLWSATPLNEDDPW
jgi:hypothetical protein